jgi:hypothetical protein
LRFAPLSLTRPIGDLRIGILTNTERWKLLVPTAEIYFETETYLKKKFPSTEKADIHINAALIPSEEVAVAIVNLTENEQLVFNDQWLATKGDGTTIVKFVGEEPLILSERWHIYQQVENRLIFQTQIPSLVILLLSSLKKVQKWKPLF